MTMSVETWLAKVAASRPALSDSQIARLRPVLAPAFTPKQDAPPAAQRETRPEHPETAPEGNSRNEPTG